MVRRQGGKISLKLVMTRTWLAALIVLHRFWFLFKYVTYPEKSEDKDVDRKTIEILQRTRVLRLIV